MKTRSIVEYCQSCAGAGMGCPHCQQGLVELTEVVSGQLVTGWDIKDAGLPLPTKWEPAGYDEYGDQLFEVPEGVYL